MRWIVGAVVASAALVGLYLALGGASYEPAAVADPCETRDWREPSGFQEVVEQIALSGLDGAACELGVTREEMVLAFESRDSLQQFARDHGISDDELAALVREGIDRALDDAVAADALNSTLAALIRGAVARIPVERLLDFLDQLPGL
jgi:hypothetical protein